MKNFVPKCGKETIIQCDSCEAPLRGKLIGSMKFRNSPPKPYCYDCGKPYPWTREAIKVAQDLAKENTELDEKDRRILSESIPEILNDSPRTKLAISRFKKIMTKVGKATYVELKDALIEYASRTTQKAIWGD